MFSEHAAIAWIMPAALEARASTRNARSHLLGQQEASSVLS